MQYFYTDVLSILGDIKTISVEQDRSFTIVVDLLYVKTTELNLLLIKIMILWPIL